MLPEVRRSKPLRFWLRYSTTDGAKKCSDPWAPNSGNARASSAVMTRAPPPEREHGDRREATAAPYARAR